MQLNLKGKHIFSLVKLINKMNIKKDVKEFFKIATKNANKKNTASLKLKLAHQFLMKKHRLSYM